MSKAEGVRAKLNIRQPKTKKGEQTLQRICVAAEELFYLKGYHLTCIKDITDKAGLGLGTFYLYFPDKLTLYSYLLLQYSHRIRLNIAQKIEERKASSRREAEQIGLWAFLELVRAEPHAYHIIWQSMYIDKNLFVQYYADFGKLYSKQLRLAQAAGEVNDFDPELAAFMLMGIANFVGLRYAVFDQMGDLEFIAAEVLRILSEGMFQPPKSKQTD